MSAAEQLRDVAFRMRACAMCNHAQEVEAIAATLDSGECENVSKLNRDGVTAYFFTCSECGLSVCAGVGIGEIELKSPRRFAWKHGMYEFERCPRCGKVVKR